MTNEEKSRVLSVKASCEAYFNKEAQKQYLNPSTETIARINAYGACMEMAEWKDEQHKKEIADLQRKLNAEKELRKQVEDSVRGLPQPIKDLIKAMNMII